MRFALGFTTILTGREVQAQNQSDVFDQFFRYTEPEHAVFYDSAPDEAIDPFSGTLHIVQTDVVLPGRAGLDLRIVRSYSSKMWGRTDDPSLASLLADTDRSLLGYGWSFHMGRIKNPNASGQPTSPCSADYPLVEMADGEARVFYRVSASNPRVYASRDYWRMETNCSLLGGKGSCVWSDTGIRYEFSNAFGNSYTVGQVVLVWPVTAIVDPHDNRISISYVQDNSGAISTITDTYNRTISFTYANGGDGSRLDTMTVGANVYHYLYTPFPTLGGGTFVPRRFLTQVVPPAGPSFSYTYAISVPVTQNQYALSSVTYPHGGRVSYAYTSSNFFAGVGPSVPFAVVSSKTVTDRGGASSGTWVYRYSAPSSGMNTTIITRPDGRGGTTNDAYTMFGFGAVSSGSVWKVGLTQQISLGGGAELRTFSWDGRTSTPVAASLYSAPGYSICAGSQPLVDNVVYAPALARKDVQRDGTTYSTIASNWDGTGQPQNASESGQFSRTVSWTYFSRATDSNGQTLNLMRDRPLTQTVCVSGECVTNSWSYNGPGYAMDTETRSGVSTIFGYNPDGTLAQVTDAVGKVLKLSGYDIGKGTPTSLDFGGAFQFTRSTTWEGWIQTQTDGRNNVTQYDYDGIGRVIKVTPPGPNQATTYTYDNISGITIAAQRSGAGGPNYTVTTTLDGFGRNVGTVDTLGTQTSVKYDDLGQVWFRSSSFDGSTGEVGEKVELDVLGRVTTLTRACRGANTPVSNCAPTQYVSTVTNVYQAGNCVQTTEQRIPDSLATRRCYSSFGSPDERRLTAITDAAGRSWAYTYTAIGNLHSVTAPLAAGNRTYEYDSRQYLSGQKSGELGLIPVDTVSMRYIPNAIGQVTSRTDARGVSWTYDYNDPLNRLTSITYGQGSGDNMSKSYEPSTNNVAMVSSPKGGTLSYNVYDELNRLRRQQWSFSGILYTTTFNYDVAGCLNSISYPTGSVITQTCDAANRVTSITFNGSALVSNIVYHPSGQPKSMTFANGTSTTVVYDDRGRSESISSPGVITLVYQYDGLDNVISLDNTALPGSIRTMQGGYDNLNRLISVQAPNLWGSATYKYDDLGNRTLKSVGTLTETYTHDPQTNRLTTASGSDSILPMTFTWDLAARLSSSSDGTSYYYTGMGSRAEKVEPNQTTVYHDDVTGHLISETLPNGTKLRDYIYLGNRLITLDGCISTGPPQCSERRWYHTDALGSIFAETDATGKVVARFDYQPWGESWNPGALAGDRQYNGRVLDPGTGFYDYGARLYWPTIARFISSDTASPEPHDPLTLNRYIYALDNPYKFVDPTGKAVILNSTYAGDIFARRNTALAVLSAPDSSFWQTVKAVTSIAYIDVFERTGASFLPGPSVIAAPEEAVVEAPAALSAVRASFLALLRARALRLAGFAEEGAPIVLDENLAAPGTAEALRARGFNVRSILEIFGKNGVKDPEINKFAEAVGARVLTADRGRKLGEGFGKLAIQVSGKVSGQNVNALVRILSEATK